MSPLSLDIPQTHANTISALTTELLHAYATHSPPQTQGCICSTLLSHGHELINAVEFQAAELGGNAHKSVLIHSSACCLRAAACTVPFMWVELLADEERILLQDLI